jgi:hypothetical protein
MVYRTQLEVDAWEACENIRFHELDMNMTYPLTTMNRVVTIPVLQSVLLGGIEHYERKMMGHGRRL